MYKIGLILVLSLVQGRPQISLEYKPTRPFYHPKPSGSNVGQIIPPGKPWPDNQQSYQNFTQLTPDSIVDRIKEPQPENGPTSTASSFLWPVNVEDESANSTSGTKEPNDLIPPEKPTLSGTISLEYQPMRPPYHPKPGDYVGQIVPPSKPWPASPEDYPNFSQTTNTPVIVDRIDDFPSTEKATTDITQEQTPINIEYKPNRPFYHPKPGNTVAQIVPPGKPSPQDEGIDPCYIPDRIQETPTTPATGFIWHSNLKNEGNVAKQPNDLLPVQDSNPSSTKSVSLVDRIKGSVPLITERADTPNKIQEQTLISLEYKPNRPFHHPNPGNVIAQIIPPGKPWPAGPEGYQNLSQSGNPDLVNRIQETTPSNTQQVITAPARPDNANGPIIISLEYKPNRPFHAGGSSSVSHPIPPGNPWPSNPEENQNFNQSETSTTFVNRIKDTTSSVVKQTTTIPTTVEEQKKPISLEYKPNTPFHGTAGNVIKPTVPIGEPWPASAEGYQNFSQAGTSTTFVNRIKDTTSSVVKQTSTVPTTVEEQKKPISLEYQPNTPFHGTAGNVIKPTIPIGEPWPASAEGYQNFSQTSKPIVLEYEPTRPSFHPNPGDTIGQIVPPGEPWPSSLEGYQNFSQRPVLEDRIKDTSSSSVQEAVTLAAVPEPTLINSGQGAPPGKLNGAQTSSLLLDRLQELVNKRKSQTTVKPPQSSFIWETETSSEDTIYQNEQSANETSSETPLSTEKPSSESSSEETSTIGATTKIAQSATEGKLFTSPPLPTIIKKETILEPSVTTIVREEGHRRPIVRSAPFALLPFNWSPSHYIFYI